MNPDLDKFNCWHCGFQGGSLAVLMVRGSAEQREYLDERGVRSDASAKVERPPCTTLPEGYVPFRLSGTREEAPYLTYVRRRGVTDDTMALYRMGYADTGFLAGRVIVPSFDRHGSVNFWSARTIYPGETTFRYRLPLASKDVISNEHMVDWASPVYIVEGIFDEIAIGSQAIALYGKHLPPKLAVTLVQKKPPMTYICLDKDALDDAYDMLERLASYDLPCSVLDLAGKDPGELGSAGVAEAVGRTLRVTGTLDLVRSQL